MQREVGGGCSMDHQLLKDCKAFLNVANDVERVLKGVRVLEVCREVLAVGNGVYDAGRWQMAISL